MGRRSSIERLPAEVQKAIADLRRQGRTLDEIMAKLRELDVDVSRTSLWRHTRQLDAIAEHMRKSQDMARALTDRFGDSGIGDLARYNLQVAHGLLMRLMFSETGEAIQLDAKEAMFLTSALKNVVTASKSDAEREIKLREKIVAEHSDRLDDLEQEVGGDRDDTITMADALERVRQHLGIG